MLQTLLVYLRLVREGLVYLISEFYTPKCCQPHVVVTDLADCVLDIDIAFLRNKAAIFYGHEVEIVVYLAVHNEKGLND